MNTFIPIHFLRRPLVRLGDIVFSRLSLLVLGFFRIDSKYGNLRRLRLVAKQTKKYSFGYGVEESDILLCNYSSFVQIIALSYYFSPTFTGMTDRGTAYVLSLPSALWRCFDRPCDKGKYPRSVPLSMIVESKKYDGPIVVFPEIARTNGKGVLKFSAWYVVFDREACESIVVIIKRVEHNHAQHTGTVRTRLHPALKCFSIELMSWHSNFLTKQIPLLSPWRHAWVPCVASLIFPYHTWKFHT